MVYLAVLLEFPPRWDARVREILETHHAQHVGLPESMVSMNPRPATRSGHHRAGIDAFYRRPVVHVRDYQDPVSDGHGQSAFRRIPGRAP